MFRLQVGFAIWKNLHICANLDEFSETSHQISSKLFPISWPFRRMISQMCEDRGSTLDFDAVGVFGARALAAVGFAVVRLAHPELADVAGEAQRDGARCAAAATAAHGIARPGARHLRSNQNARLVRRVRRHVDGLVLRLAAPRRARRRRRAAAAAAARWRRRPHRTAACLLELLPHPHAGHLAIGFHLIRAWGF